MRRRDILITFLILFLILIFSLFPFSSPEEAKRYEVDKIGHLIFYTFWGYFSYPIIGFFSLIFGMVLGIITESAQRFIPNRDSSVVDFLFNLFGIFLGIFIRRLRKV
ncbi:MAG: hypothetical protein ABIK81_02590 [candidate division WOR-3 bacterium]